MVESEVGGDLSAGQFPDARRLAELVSDVTEIVCGTNFVPIFDVPRGESLCGRMVLMPIRGDRDISVVLSSDVSGVQGICAAMFGSPSDKLTNAMIEDSTRELLNMVAGRIKTALEIDQALGLPRITSLAEISKDTGIGVRDAILLRGKGVADVNLWVFEKVAQAPYAEKMRAFRSLFRRPDRPE